MTREVIKKWESILQADKDKDITYGRKVIEEMLYDFKSSLPPAEGVDPKKVQWSGYGELGNIKQQPIAEGAEVILDRIVGSEKPCGIITRPDTIDAMREFATRQVEEATKDCYPKDFVEWYVTEGQFKNRFIGVKMNPLAEAFDYWKEKEQ